MTKSAADVSMALFCDFENIALGVRDAQYEKFDIKPVLERLLLKGSIVVKKAYCDWDRYKSFKAAMHEANFELIEIPHVRQSGKNSADIRMVVDALDLCYTKSHVDTFVIISGDSDFSPLVSKLRENAKRVIGIGVKQSTSDLLIANCDEFIYIDDLMRKRQREDKQPRKPVEPQEMETRRAKGLELAAATLEALLEDRADDEKVWASVVKEALKRRHPGFNENYHGFKTFGALLEEAHKRGLLEFGRDNNNAYAKRRATGASPAAVESAAVEMAVDPNPAAAVPHAGHFFPPVPNMGFPPVTPSSAEVLPPQGEAAPTAKRRGRTGKSGKTVKTEADAGAAEATAERSVAIPVVAEKPPAGRARSPRKARKPVTEAPSKAPGTT